MMKLVEKVENSNLIEYEDKIIIGVSGGPDSVCLFDVLLKLKEKYKLSLFVVHVNHRIREEAEEEENYVKELAVKNNIPFFAEKVDVKGLAETEKKSLEEMARDVRYSIFNKILVKVGAKKIAVAHNANDLAETIIMNLTRGCGINGLCGIKKENGNIIRPLLNITRKEILEYVKENSLKVFFDKTNFETEYTRNRIRNIVIPELIKVNPGFVETITRTAQILEGQKNILYELVDSSYYEVCERKNVLNKEKFLELSYGMQLEVLRKAVNEFNGNLVDIGQKNLVNALDIIHKSQSGNIVEILPNVKIEISYDLLKFFSEVKEKVDFCYEVKIDGDTYIPEIGKKIVTKIAKVGDVPNKYEDRNKCFFDIEKVGKKIYVRNKHDGDFFEPAGMSGRKSLKKFFSDLKIEANDRNKIPIITNGDEIIWIAGFRTSKRFLKDNNTKEVIIFEYGENI